MAIDLCIRLIPSGSAIGCIDSRTSGIDMRAPELSLTFTIISAINRLAGGCCVSSPKPTNVPLSTLTVAVHNVVHKAAYFAARRTACICGRSAVRSIYSTLYAYIRLRTAILSFVRHTHELFSERRLLSACTIFYTGFGFPAK